MEVKDGISLFKQFVSIHKSQLESSGVPGHFWEILSKKLSIQAFDAGEAFSILKIEYEDEQVENVPLNKVVVSCEEGVKKDDPKHIYLIDHAWTFSVDKAKDHLREIPGLALRMANMMDIPCNEEDEIPSGDLVDKVFDEMWKYAQTYAVGADSAVEDRLRIWYIMDEFGSAIQHSDDPNFRTIPFIYLPEGITYSLLFPIKDVANGEEVTRDYIEGPFRDELTRKALLLPWQPSSFLSVSFKQEEPDEGYFLEGRVAESFPNLANFVDLEPEDRERLSVFAEYKYIHRYLTHPKFYITEDENRADILWYTKHFKCFEEFSEFFPYRYLNQFPYENVITVKDLLSIVCRRKNEGTEGYNPDTLETYPVWLPTTFNLTTELPKFVSYYQHREAKGLDNHWICKPFNLARGLDTHITSNLNYILRLPCTGPKIAQKYIEDPVLFDRPEIGKVKFDVRYVLLLKKVSPLEAFAYKNFFLRFANHPFELKDFEDYEKHFTVMNYSESAPLCHMLCDEFILKFEEQNAFKWKDVEEKIFSMLREMFEAATSKDLSCGIAQSPQSRAVYAADIMLAWRTNENGEREIQPKLLEVNWTPDCQRACNYYPDFYNDIFGLLFFDEMKEVFQLL